MTKTEPRNSVQRLWKVASWVGSSLSERGDRYLRDSNGRHLKSHSLSVDQRCCIFTCHMTCRFLLFLRSRCMWEFYPLDTHVSSLTCPTHRHMYMCVCMHMWASTGARVLHFQVEPSHQHVFATFATLLQSRRSAVRVLVSASLRPIKIHATSSWQVINFHFRCATTASRWHFWLYCLWHFFNGEFFYFY